MRSFFCSSIGCVIELLDYEASSSFIFIFITFSCAYLPIPLLMGKNPAPDNHYDRFLKYNPGGECWISEPSKSLIYCKKRGPWRSEMVSPNRPDSQVEDED